jgi:hypothetical protein
MTGRARESVNRTRTLASAALAVALIAPAAAQAHDRPLARAKLYAPGAGEAKLALTAWAPGTDWGTAGSESAVLSVAVDGRPVANVVTYNGAAPLEYDLALGRVGAGRHEITITLDREKSPSRRAEVRRLRPSLAPAGDLVARYAPVLYGRDLPEIPGRYENASTDVPLLAYHTTGADAQGNRTIEYTTIWSNEDGGTNTPALMARWGRTTDIEWIYRVTVDANGDRVSDAYQAANHETKAFDGVREADHPLLQTATANNNTAAVSDPARSSGYRFFLDTAETLPPARAREAAMDAHPWSYQVMAKEMVREGKVEPVASPDTPLMSDQRGYLFAEVKKATTYAARPPAGSWAGTALAVKPAGSDRWYTSHHGVPDWSLQRDDPAATTVELPQGTTAADIQAIKAIAVPVGTPGDFSIDVTALNRGFLLATDYLPGASFVTWTGKETLTPQRPEAVIWQR